MSALRQILVLSGIVTCLAVSLPAQACIPASYDTLRKFTAVIVEGEFRVIDEAAGTGYIVPKRVEKGRRLRRYAIRWNPNLAEELQPHERDCMVQIPESGLEETFWLARGRRGTFEIINRYERVRKAY